MPEALVYQALGAIFISNWGQIPIKSWLVACLLLAGSRPGRRGTFLCFAKEKYPKERRPCCPCPCASLRATCGARSRGVPQNSLRAARFVQTTAASQSTKHARCDAHARPAPCAPRHGQKGVGTTRAIAALGPAKGAPRAGPSAAMARLGLFNPLGLRLGRGACGVGMRVEARMHRPLACRGCMNGAPQARSEFCGTPRKRPDPGLPRSAAKGSQTWGRLFFAYFLLAKQKKVSAPPGAYPGQQHQKEELPATYQQALDAKINWSLTPIRLTPIRFPNRCKRVVNWNLTPIKGAGGVA